MSEEKPQEGEEVVSVEDLVSDATAEQTESSAQAQPAAEENARTALGASLNRTSRSNPVVSGLQSSDIEMARIDAILEMEDPVFARSMSEMKKDKILEIPLDGADADIDDFVNEDKVDTTAPPPKIDPFGTGLKGVIKRTWHGFKTSLGQIAGGAGAGAGSLKQGLAALLSKGVKGLATSAVVVLKSSIGAFKSQFAVFWAMPRKSKLAGLFMLVLLASFGFMVGRMSKGKLLPDLTFRFLPTVAAYADSSWRYDEAQPLEDFYSPFRHPEHVVLLDKVVVNLRPSENSEANPMGFFEFYLELTSRDTAVEVGDRQSEILDTVQRTVEGMTYDEIVTAAGKNKLKLVIRKNVNTVLTRGRVRKVFYKSVIIKP